MKRPDVSSLNRLKVEWSNIFSDEMRPLLLRLLKLKETHTYQQVWMELCRRDHRRYAHEIEYVSRLLYIADERPLPVVIMQHAIGIEQGHMYRTFERAGVEWKASTANTGVSVEEHYVPWAGKAFVDVLGKRVIQNGEIKPIKGDILHFKVEDSGKPPIPILPKLK